MKLPQNRYDFGSHRPRKRSNLGKFILIFLILGAVGVAGVRFIFRDELGLPALGISARQRLLSLWDAKDYQEIIRVTEEELARNPMDADCLVFHGFAHFYTGVNQMATEEKLAHIDAAIRSLRRVRLYQTPPLAGELDYVLGKAYYQKGEYYADLSVQYMVSSVDKKFLGQDSYEYLGFAYNTLGEYDRSIEFLLRASETNPSDLLYLALAQTYYQTGDRAASEEYLDRAINKSSDTALIQKARATLGDIYLQDREYLKAEAQYLKIIEINPQNADANFYLGEIYFNMGDPIKARASWRRALRIDPNHFGAKTRLYSRR
ncbi:MAG: tetratricopeptide repeat protein [Spirochaetales bacterium]|jgi:tetratricopeptide (TPR) repeat protein|nr:tetratricopeptide repeat protein [Spirochaetales bacterium]